MHKTTHQENVIALRRIEGQVKGVQKMIEEKKYCVDIVNQIHAAARALYRVSDKIFKKHLQNCVVEAFRGRSKKKRDEKIIEIMGVINRLYK